MKFIADTFHLPEKTETADPIVGVDTGNEPDQTVLRVFCPGKPTLILTGQEVVEYEALRRIHGGVGPYQLAETVKGLKPATGATVAP